MQTTTNYELKKPDAATDNIDISIINGNMDIMDTQVKTNESAIAAHTNDYLDHIPYAGITTGEANSYVISEPVITELKSGMAVSLTPNINSTGASILNWCGLGAKAMKNSNGFNVSNLKTTGIYTFRYNGTDFILQGAEGSGFGADIELREKVTMLENKLQEANLMSFVNKTGIGFYDTFEDEDFVDKANTSAVYDDFNNKFKFSTDFSKIKALASAENSTSINVDQLIYTGDVIEGATVTAVTNNSVQVNKDFTTTKPTTFTSQATLDNTKKPIILDNGWQLMPALASSIITFRVSKDNGETWDNLCSFNGVTITDYSIAFKGTTIFLLVLQGTTEVWCYSFDAYTTSNVNIYTNYGKAVRLDWNQTALGTCHIIINSYNKLVAVWSSKNSTYSNAYNIRMSYSTDLNTTWSTQIQMTMAATANSTDVTLPFLLSKNDGSILLFYNNNYGGDTVCATLNSTLTAISSSNVPITGTIHNASCVNGKPCAILIKYGTYSGRIVCIVNNYTSSATGYSQICINYSDDGGTTWKNGTSGSVIIANETSYGKFAPSLAQDTTGRVHIFCHGKSTTNTTYSNIKYLYTDNCVSFSALVPNLILGSSADVLNPVVCTQVETCTHPMIAYTDTASGSIKLWGNYTLNTSSATVTLNSPVSVTLGQILTLTRMQRLSMSTQSFDNFTSLSLGAFAPINKAKIKNPVSNSTSVVTTPSGRKISANDVVFLNGALNSVISASANNIPGGGNVSFSTISGVAFTNAPPQYLSNGWIITTVYNGSSTINFYVSKDNGITYTLLTSLSAVIYNATALNTVSVCSLGIMVYIAYHTTSSSTISFAKFDATTVGSTITLYSNSVALGTMIGGLSICVSNDGILFAMCGLNGSSTTLYSIRSINGGLTWTGVDGTSNYSYISNSPSGYHPVMVALSNTTFCFVYNYGNSYPFFGYYNGSSFTITPFSTQQFNGASGVYKGIMSLYVQKYGSHIGRIWRTQVLGTSSPRSIIAYYSDDFGATWSTQIVVASCAYEQACPSITEDINGNIYFVWQGYTAATPSNYNIRMCMYNGSALGSITELTSRVDDNNILPMVCSGLNNFTVPLLAYQDTYNFYCFGTYSIQQGWNLTLQNPVTASPGDTLYLQDFTVKNNGITLPLSFIDDEKHVFSSDILADTNVDLDISSDKVTECTSIAYAVV